MCLTSGASASHDLPFSFEDVSFTWAAVNIVCMLSSFGGGRAQEEVNGGSVEGALIFTLLLPRALVKDSPRARSDSRITCSSELLAQAERRDNAFSFQNAVSIFWYSIL